jgi:hypothetical protein
VRTLAAAAIAGLLVLAGCGGGGGHEDARDALRVQARAVRADLEAGRVSEAQGGLAQLRATVRDANASGAIDDEKAASILDAAKAVESTIAAATAPPPTTTTVTPATAPAPRPKDEHRKGKGHKDD